MSDKNLEDQLLSHEVEIASDLPFRKWLYAWLLDPHIEGNHQKTIENWIGILIVANLFALVFEHVPAIYEPNSTLVPLF
jgi:voltage-gated potassium channel